LQKQKEKKRKNNFIYTKIPFLFMKLLNIFNLFRRKKEGEKKDLNKDIKSIREVQYPIMSDFQMQPQYPVIRDLQMQSDIPYVLQVINSKIDTLLAKVDNLSLRLNNIEQLLYNFLYRR